MSEFTNGMVWLNACSELLTQNLHTLTVSEEGKIGV